MWTKSQKIPKNLSASIAVLAMIAGCSKLAPEATDAVQSASRSASPTDCQVLYDAGSSGTRLFIYQQSGDDWIEHEGPKVSALADPIRGTRGKSFDDVDSVVAEVVGALPAMLADGPLDDGEPEWAGFDWKTDCNITSASVYATAGMSIAE